MISPKLIAAYDGIPAYFQSHGVNPHDAMLVMAYVIGYMRGLEGLTVIDQDVCDIIAIGWEAGAMGDDHRPMSKPTAGKVV